MAFVVFGCLASKPGVGGRIPRQAGGRVPLRKPGGTKLPLPDPCTESLATQPEHIFLSRTWTPIEGHREAGTIEMFLLWCWGPSSQHQGVTVMSAGPSSLVLPVALPPSLLGSCPIDMPGSPAYLVILWATHHPSRKFLLGCKLELFSVVCNQEFWLFCPPNGLSTNPQKTPVSPHPGSTLHITKSTKLPWSAAAMCQPVLREPRKEGKGVAGCYLEISTRLLS